MKSFPSALLNLMTFSLMSEGGRREFINLRIFMVTKIPFTIFDVLSSINWIIQIFVGLDTFQEWRKNTLHLLLLFNCVSAELINKIFYLKLNSA